MQKQRISDEEVLEKTTELNKIVGSISLLIREEMKTHLPIHSKDLLYIISVLVTELMTSTFGDLSISSIKSLIHRIENQVITTIERAKNNGHTGPS